MLFRSLVMVLTICFAGGIQLLVISNQFFAHVATMNQKRPGVPADSEICDPDLVTSFIPIQSSIDDDVRHTKTSVHILG